MKKLLFIASMLMATNTFAHELPNYLHVKGAVSHGAKVRIVIDFNKCTSSDANVNHMIDTAVYTPNEMIVMNNGGIAASMKHFTFNDAHAKGSAVYQYVTYTVTPDDNVTLEGRVIDAVNYAPLTQKHTHVCKMTNGAHIYVD